VRPAERRDLATVAELARGLAAHVDEPDPRIDAAELAQLGFGAEPWFECIVAEDDSGVIGFALVCKRYEAHTGKRGLWIGDLFVAPSARAQGVGRALMRALHERAKSMGCAGLSWELWKPNVTGRRFYESLGAHMSDVDAMYIDSDEPRRQ
jgi:GNAT superfamily N-acetyltransferase